MKGGAEAEAGRGKEEADTSELWRLEVKCGHATHSICLSQDARAEEVVSILGAISACPADKLFLTETGGESAGRRLGKQEVVKNNRTGLTLGEDYKGGPGDLLQIVIGGHGNNLMINMGQDSTVKQARTFLRHTMGWTQTQVRLTHKGNVLMDGALFGKGKMQEGEMLRVTVCPLRGGAETPGKKDKKAPKDQEWQAEKAKTYDFGQDSDEWTSCNSGDEDHGEGTGSGSTLQEDTNVHREGGGDGVAGGGLA